MGNSDAFALFIHHAGFWHEIENSNHYVHGKYVAFYDLDPDKFGYFDMVELVEKLGYGSWVKLWYQIPKSMSYTVIYSDKEVMNMLAYLSYKQRTLNVFVEGGKRVEDVNVQTRGAEEGGGGTGETILEGLQNCENNHVEEREGVVGADIDGDSEDDVDYTPHADQNDDNDLDDVGLGSGDEEYIEAKANMNDDTLYDYIENFVLASDNEEREPVSDYDESDGEVYSSETENEDEDVKPRRPRIVYDPRCDHKDLVIKLGMQFQDGYQCRKGLRTWAIENGKYIHFKRVSARMCEAVCVKGCKWRVYASSLKADGSFKVKSYEETHSCPTAMSNKLLSSKWIAQRYLEVFRVRLNWSIEDLRRDIMHRFKVSVPKDRLYKARTIARMLVRGTVEEHYASLRRYLAELRRVDREGRYELLLTPENVFKGLYLGHSPLIKGFKQSCRPIIGLDGCFLKTYLGGILLCAVGKDGNNQMFPIAWAVVEIENEECWSWFLKLLLHDLEITHGGGWTFISDQQKGLEHAVHTLAPRAEHRNCARHVYMNWKKQHKGSTLKNLFWNTVRCTTVEDYKLATMEIKKESVAAYQDFIDRDVSRFCKAFISTEPCSDMIDNNISETFNGYILNARGKHIIHMCEEIRSSLMVRQVKKLNDMTGVCDLICPMVMKKLEKIKHASRYCTATPALGNKFEVEVSGDKFVVNIENRSCSCREWNLTGIPCKHACSAFLYMNKDPSTYVHEYYYVKRYLLAYQFGIEPITSEKYWPEVQGAMIKPPSIKKRAGRPKKNRIKDPDEKDPRNHNKLRRSGQKVTCKNCGQEGHNTRTCKNEKVQKAPSRKRGRPRKNPAPTLEVANGQERLVGTVAMTPAERAIVAKERRLAKKGGGVYINEGTGNTYLHMPASRRVIDVQRAFKAPRAIRATTSSSHGEASNSREQSGVTEAQPTQESRNAD